MFCSLIEIISTFNMLQLVCKPTRTTESSQSLIDVIMTTNCSIICLCDVLSCSISDHDLVFLVMSLKTPRIKPTYITVRSYKHNSDEFCSDLALVPFHMTFFFNNFDDQVDTFNCFFQDVLDEHAPIKRIKIKSTPNPFVSQEIRHLMNTRDKWHKNALKSNDKLHWNAYKFFRQEVKCQLRLAEKAHVKSEIASSKRNTNAIWKIINRCLPNKKKQNFF